MDRFIYIRNDEDDAYMNKVSNFRGMTQTGSGAVVMYFESAVGGAGTPDAYDKITLAVTANSEKEAMVAIGGALAGGKSGSTAVIADDHGSAYCDDTVTGVTTIATASGGTLLNTRIITSSGAIAAGESGTTFLINTASADLTLPAAAAGMNYKFILGVDADASNSIQVNAGDCFYGTVVVVSTTADNTEVQHVTRAAALAAPGDFDFLDFEHDVTTIGGKAGDVIELTCDGGACWHVNATLTMDGDPGTIAVINAG
jgi:hypothetical protein